MPNVDHAPVRQAAPRARPRRRNRQHLDEKVDDLIADGVPRDEAIRRPTASSATSRCSRSGAARCGAGTCSKTAGPISVTRSASSRRSPGFRARRDRRRSRSASAPTPPCSASSMPSCCGRCRFRTPDRLVSVASRRPARTACRQPLVSDLLRLPHATRRLRADRLLSRAPISRSPAGGCPCACAARSCRGTSSRRWAVEPAVGRGVPGR